MAASNPKQWKGALLENLILLSNQGYKGSQIASILQVSLDTLYGAIKNLKRRGVIVGALGGLAFQNTIKDDILLCLKELKDQKHRADKRAWAQRYYAKHRDEIRGHQREYFYANRDILNKKNTARYYRAKGWCDEDINKLIIKE